MPPTPEEHSDTQLLSFAAQGDADCRIRYMKRYTPVLFRYACALTGDPFAADRLLQQTLPRAWHQYRLDPGDQLAEHWAGLIRQQSTTSTDRKRPALTAWDHVIAQMQPANAVIWLCVHLMQLKPEQIAANFNRTVDRITHALTLAEQQVNDAAQDQRQTDLQLPAPSRDLADRLADLFSQQFSFWSSARWLACVGALMMLLLLTPAIWYTISGAPTDPLGNDVKVYPSPDAQWQINAFHQLTVSRGNLRVVAASKSTPVVIQTPAGTLKFKHGIANIEIELPATQPANPTATTGIWIEMENGNAVFADNQLETYLDSNHMLKASIGTRPVLMSR